MKFKLGHDGLAMIKGNCKDLCAHNNFTYSIHNPNIEHTKISNARKARK